MMAKSSLVGQVSILLGEPCTLEEGIALMELVLQKVGEEKSVGLREMKTENLAPCDTEQKHAKSLQKFPDSTTKCELCTPHELLAVLEATKNQVSTYLSKVEVEKAALRTHLSVLGTLTARYKQQFDAARTANQFLQKELNNTEAAYVEVQEAAMRDRDTIAELNRRLAAPSSVAEAEEQIHSLRRQLALRGADFNKLDSQVYSLQFQVNTLTEQIRFLENQSEKDNALHKELQQKIEHFAQANTKLTAKLAVTLSEKTTAELALAQEKSSTSQKQAELAELANDNLPHSTVYPSSVLTAEKTEPPVASTCKRPRHGAALPSTPSDSEEENTQRLMRADQEPDRTEENASRWSDLEAMDAKIMQKAVQWGGRGNGLGAFLEKELGFGAKLRLVRLLQLKT